MGPVSVPGSLVVDACTSTGHARGEGQDEGSARLRLPPPAMQYGAPVEAAVCDDPWGNFHGLCAAVEREGVHILEGNTINVQLFRRKIDLLVQDGSFSRADADYLVHGLTWGFDLGALFVRWRSCACPSHPSLW